jgi:acyl-CoA thioesterase FadM
VAFSISYPTRHTDTFTDTGFVHAGVLLALTELAYAAFEEHCGVSKPDHVVAVQRETRAVYHAPLAWREGATIEVTTTSTDDRGFEQEFAVRSTARGTPVATFVHAWAWLDTVTGRGIPIPPDVQFLLQRGGAPS